MVSVLQANLISCRVGFVLSCFFKSMFSCSLLWRERYSRPFHWALTLSINTRVVDRAAIEPNRRVYSEVGSWKSEVENRKSKVRSRKSEVGSRRSEVRSGKWEVRRSSHSALSLNGQKSEIRSSHIVKSEVWSWKSEVRSRKTLLGFRTHLWYQEPIPLDCKQGTDNISSLTVAL